MDKIKQVIVMRKDLNLSKGRLVTQGAHASIAFLTNKMKMKENISNPEALWWVNLTQAEKEWVYGTFFKICVFSF